MWDPYAEFEKKVLPNGLSIYNSTWAERTWEYVGIIVHSGAKQDPVGLEGTAHFVEHVLTHNGRLSHKEMEKFFFFHGGHVDYGRINLHATKFHFKLPAEEKVLSEAFSFFGELILSANIEKGIEHERKVIHEEYNKKFSSVLKRQMTDIERKVLYSDTWIERCGDIVGSPETIGKINLDDLQHHYDVHYTPQNISFVCVGGMAFSMLERAIVDSPLSVHKKGERTALPAKELSVVPPTERQYVLEMSKYMRESNASNTASYYSTALLPGIIHDEVVYLVQDMLNEALTEELRERRKWTYSVFCSNHCFHNMHEFTIKCHSFQLSALDEIEGVVDSTIKNLCEDTALFETLKQHGITRLQLLDISGRSLHKEVVDELANTQTIQTLQQTLDIRHTLTIDDVRNVVCLLTANKRWTCIVKP